MELVAASRCERRVGGGASVNGRGVEQGHLGVSLADQKRDLRAPQNDGLCALRREPLQDGSTLAARLGRDDSQAQFFVDDAMNGRAVVWAGNDDSQAVTLAQSVAIEGLFHREPGAE